VASVDPAEVVPRPAKPARQNWRARAVGLRAPGTRRLRLRFTPRKVCRAGFAGRGTPSALW